jgi:hypothetical protein
MPDWVNDVALDLKLSKCGFVIYKMSTLEIMPVHVDHYHTYCKVFDVDRADVVRTIVFLEDWKPGHYSEIDGVGITNWKAGDYIQWQADVPHAAANIGIAPRYTLQITGVLEHEL